MALDSRKKRAAALGWGRIYNFPSVEPDGTLTRTDRYMMLAHYPPAGDGVPALFGTVLGSGVTAANDEPGFYGDEDGNFRATGKIHEGP